MGLPVPSTLYPRRLSNRDMSQLITGDSSTIFDSLPYFDNDLEILPNLQKKVDQELSRELKQQQGLHPLVPPPFELFSVSYVCRIPLKATDVYLLKKDDLLKAELSRVESHNSLPPLDTIRHQLPAPTSIPGSDEEWILALKNAKSQLEHQRIRYVSFV